MVAREVLAFGARGAVAAMAMTGMRRVTTGLGLIRRTPPELVAQEGVPALLRRIPPEHRDEAIELAHWGYGAAAGAAFAALPASARASVWAGPVYGLGIWALFEGVIAPLFALRGVREWGVAERVAVGTDHVLYGLVVGARPRRG